MIVDIRLALNASQFTPPHPCIIHLVVFLYRWLPTIWTALAGDRMLASDIVLKLTGSDSIIIFYFEVRFFTSLLFVKLLIIQRNIH